jgi:hypothetical protein
MRIRLSVLAFALLCASAFGQSSSGSLTANSQCVSVRVQGGSSSTVTIDVSGTWSATLQPEVVIGTGTAKNVQVVPSTALQTPQSTITSNGAYFAPGAGVNTFKVCTTSYASGTAVVTLNVTTGGVAGLTSGGGGGGGGDTITSPNSTLAVGGSSSNTTLDLEGSAGEIMAGATPALTYTPTLGASGHTGSVTLVNTNGGTSNAITENSTGLTVGTVTSGAWNGTLIGSTYGGTGVNNGSATITLGSASLNFATLGTGIVKNTTTTGALTNALAADVYGLFTSCTGSSGFFLKDGGTCAAPSGSGTVNSGTSTHLAYYASSTTAVSDAGADFVFNGTHTWTGGSSGIFDWSAVTPTDFKIPVAAGAAPTADGQIATNSTTHAMNVGSNGTTLVEAIAASGATSTGTTCTNQFLSAISGAAAPTCSTVALTALASQTADTMVANMTAGSAVPTAVAIPTTAHGVWLGEGTGTAPGITAAGATNTVLHGNTSADPTYSAIATGDIAANAVTSAKVDSSVVTDSGNTTTTAQQVAVSTTTAGAQKYIDFPETLYIPAANCNNTTAGAGWSIPSGGTAGCRGGTNNLGGFITITDTSSTFAQFTLTIPADWDSATRPYIRFFFSAASDTTSGHTVIPQVKVSCPTANNGTTSDDATFSAAQSSSTVTFGASAVANGFYGTSNIQFGSTQMTGCIASGLMVVQVGRATDTATGNINFYGASVTFPRLIVVQAN